MKSNALFMLLVGASLLTACDRRDDPQVDPADTGVINPPGETVDTTNDGMTTPPATPAPIGDNQPPTTPPGVPAACEGLAEAEQAACVERERTPTDTPPESSTTPIDSGPSL